MGKADRCIHQLRRSLRGKISPAGADRLLSMAVIEWSLCPYEREPPLKFIEEVMEALGVLERENPRVARALKLRFGQADLRVRTYKEVGDELGVTGERARQLCQRGICKLYFLLKAQGCWRLLGF